MSTFVSTGQITIIDSNDARTVTAVLSSSVSSQQIYTSGDNASYIPNWFETAIVLTPSIYISGLTKAKAWGALSNKKFSLVEGGEALIDATTSTVFANGSGVAVTNPFTLNNIEGATTPSTLTIKGNLKDGTPPYQIFFEANYTDPITTLETTLVCSISLSTIKTGTNAVYVTIRGQTVIEQARGKVKNGTCVSADLIRAGVIDTSNLSYKWFESNATGLQIINTPAYNTKYGTKYSAFPATTGYAAGDIGKNLPADGLGMADNVSPYEPFNTLVMTEAAVNKIGLYRVDVTDTVNSKTYSAHFNVYDVSDPYAVSIIASADKLINGQGSTSLYPSVRNGGIQLTATDIDDWTFSWKFFDRSGYRGAFIDTTKIATLGGAPITACGFASQRVKFTYTGTHQFSENDLIKVVNASGNASFYEVFTGETVNAQVCTVTIKLSAGDYVNTWLSKSEFPVPTGNLDSFIGGRLYACSASRTTTGSTPIVVSGDEIDAKSMIVCDASKP